MSNPRMSVEPAYETREAASYSDRLVFWLNGQEVVISNPDPTVLLVDYLHGIGLTGTKVGCGQGGCGACTVMLSRREGVDGRPDHRAINACLRPLCAVDGMMVTTTEGIGSAHRGMDPTQYVIAANNGTQCGSCTPGFVMTAHAFLQQTPAPSQQEIEDLFGGNPCRCTGYRPILHGVRTLASDFDAARDVTPGCLIDPPLRVPARCHLAPVCLGALPPAGKPPRALHFSGGGREWYRPGTLAEVHRLEGEFVGRSGRDAVKIVFGNTASGVYPREKPAFLIDSSAIAELGRIAEGDAGLQVGAAVPIQRLIDFAAEVIRGRPAERTTGLVALVRHAGMIAGYQVRCAGSVAGNIFMTRDHAHRGTPFPSDLFTILATLGTTVVIGSRDYRGGNRAFPLMQMPDADALPDDAVILMFHIPFIRPREYVQTYRVARRPQMAHPIVNAGFRYGLDDRGRVEAGGATIIYGGLASMAYRARETEQFLVGKPWDGETLWAALLVLKEEVRGCTIPMDEEGIGTDYRLRLAEDFFYKSFLHVALAVRPDGVTPTTATAANHRDRPLSSGTQEYTEYPELYPLTRPILKRAAFAQATGEAGYTQDIPLPAGGLHAEIVKSSRPHARFSLTGRAPTLDALRGRYADFKAFVTVEPTCSTTPASRPTPPSTSARSRGATSRASGSRRPRSSSTTRGAGSSPTTSGATSPRAARPSRSISGSGSIRSTRRATPWRRKPRCTPSSRRRAPASRA